MSADANAPTGAHRCTAEEQGRASHLESDDARHSRSTRVVQLADIKQLFERRNEAETFGWFSEVFGHIQNRAKQQDKPAVEFISRQDPCVSNASELFPEPETLVKTTSFFLGISSVTPTSPTS